MKYILIIASVLLIAITVLIFNWFSDDSAIVEPVEPVEPVEIAQQSADRDDSVNDVEQDERYLAMQARYKALERARRDLDRSLARIKAKMWNVELPAAQARDINRQIRQAYEFLKFKKLLGAFSDIQEIEDELARIRHIDNSLDNIIKVIEDNKDGQTDNK